MTFAASLKKAREELGLTQQELSQLLHVSYSTINRYENGRHLPSPLALDAITTFFKKKKVPLEFDLTEETSNGNTTVSP
jgi:transcriptional regulator with XRE-family HTH domain